MGTRIYVSQERRVMSGKTTEKQNWIYINIQKNNKKNDIMRH